MRSRHRICWLVAPLIAVITGCIVSDQLTTLTINPDGSGDVILFVSNIRSTQEGEKGTAEISDYHAAFDARTQDDLRHLSESGARIERASWLREQPPLAHIVHATFPDAASLEKFATVKDGEGNEMVKTRFSVSNTSRRLSFKVTIKPDQIPPDPNSANDLKKQKLVRASGISETRLAFRNGKITDATGFLISEDKQSALLDLDEIFSLLRAGKGNAELFLEWEVAK